MILRGPPGRAPDVRPAFAQHPPAPAFRPSNLETKETRTLILAQNATSDFRIVIPRDPSEATHRAAHELRSFVQKISGADLPIVDEGERVADREILLGDNAHLRGIGASVDFGKLGDDGFTIRTIDDKHLVIAGGAARGALYGVYAFLEEHLGCRWYSSVVSRIPKQATIALRHIENTQVPILEFREVSYRDPCCNPDFAARLRLNSPVPVLKDGEVVGAKHRGWGTWCHTYFRYVPPQKHFDEHPEYFALVKGRRIHQRAQLCLTNPKVFDLIVADIERGHRENPEDVVWDVSQMDCQGNCECGNCKALDDAEDGNPMGSTLHLINRIADALPHLRISTLAYEHTRHAPKHVKPRDNVNIMLCSIECNRSKPLATDPRSADFLEDIENWSKICKNLFVWDYEVQFQNYVSPFPNLRVLQPNIQFFVENNVKGVFLQSNGAGHGEFCELRNYLLAKLAWNPYCDIEFHLNDFLKNYYGAAAEPVREYIDSMHDALADSGKNLSIFGGPEDHVDGYLAPALIERYDVLFDEAERRTADDLEAHLRVRTARMPLMYARLQTRAGDYGHRRKVADEFFDLAQRTGLAMIDEHSRPLPKYKELLEQAFTEERRIHSDPAPGPFFGEAAVRLIPSIEETDSRYTLDGSEPTADSPLYTEPIRLTRSTAIKARAFKDGKPAGPLASLLFFRARIAYESKPLHEGENPERVKVPLRGARRIMLIADVGKIDNRHAHADWADAKLTDKEGKVVYLGDLKPIHVTQGWTPTGRPDYLAIDRSIAGIPMAIGDRPFDRGLGAHVYSEILYEIEEGFERFEAWVGVDADAKGGTARFRVLIEER